MRSDAPITQRGRQRGASTTVVLLVLAILASMLGATLIMSSTTAVVTSSMRYGEERARMNALNALALTGSRIELDVKQAFLDMVHDLNGRKDSVDMTLPVLTGVQIPELEYDYPQLPGEGNTEDDRATVRAVVTLAGPPKQLGLNGLATEAKGTHQDLYTFKVRLTSEGRSLYGARQVARQEAYAYVALLIKEGTVTSVPPAVAGSTMLPARRPEPGFWDVVPPAYAAITWTIGSVGTYTIPGGMGGPTGAWAGPPEIVSGPTAIGLDNGDKWYYWYLKGVPTGSSVNDVGGKVLAMDTWRFDPTYRASDDTIEYTQQNGQKVRVKGSPEFAVVAAQAPDPYAQAEQNGGSRANWSGVTLRTPRGNVSLSTGGDRSWYPNMVTLDAPDGGTYRVVAEPNASWIVERLGQPTNPCNACWRLETASGVEVARAQGAISVRGSRQNNGMWGGPFGGAEEISLLDVNARRLRLGSRFVALPDGSEFSTAFSENSFHSSFETGGGQQFDIDDDDDPWDPPPPGEEPGAAAVVVMFVGLAPYFVPDAVVEGR